jgi:hypothetical protein
VIELQLESCPVAAPDGLPRVEPDLPVFIIIEPILLPDNQFRHCFERMRPQFLCAFNDLVKRKHSARLRRRLNTTHHRRNNGDD